MYISVLIFSRSPLGTPRAAVPYSSYRTAVPYRYSRQSRAVPVLPYFWPLGHIEFDCPNQNRNVPRCDLQGPKKLKTTVSETSEMVPALVPLRQHGNTVRYRYRTVPNRTVQTEWYGQPFQVKQMCHLIMFASRVVLGTFGDFGAQPVPVHVVPYSNTVHVPYRYSVPYRW